MAATQDEEALCKWLYDQSEKATNPRYEVPVADLPDKFAKISLLTSAMQKGYIEFGRRCHCFAAQCDPNDPTGKTLLPGGNKRLIVEEGFEWSDLRKKQYKPLRLIIEEERTLPAEHKAIRLHVRLTNEGHVIVTGNEASKLAVA